MSLKSTFRLSNAEDVDATLTITMSLRNWESLLNQLKGNEYPAWAFGDEVLKMIRHAKQEFVTESPQEGYPQ